MQLKKRDWKLGELLTESDKLDSTKNTRQKLLSNKLNGITPRKEELIHKLKTTNEKTRNIIEVVLTSQFLGSLGTSTPSVSTAVRQIGRNLAVTELTTTYRIQWRMLYLVAWTATTKEKGNHLKNFIGK